MPNAPLSDEEKLEALELYERFGTEVAAAKHVKTDRGFGISRGAFSNRLRQAREWDANGAGELDATEAGRAEGSKFILTSAQNETAVFKPFWSNLLAYAEHIGAEIKVARFRYNVSGQQAKQSKSDGVASSGDSYAAELTDYFCDERLRLADGLIWAGDMNIMPTAVDPLSGLDSFTGLDSCIFPHAKIALKSIATAMSDPRKKNYTTGAVTLSNYIKRKAGQKAEFHHAYGALLVEIDDDGVFFVRHLNADESGSFCDLDILVSGGKIGRAKIAALGAGDVHARNIDPVVKEATWGKGGLVDVLRPAKQFLGDVLDFESRSHHNDLFDSFKLHCQGGDCVESEIKETYDCIEYISRPWCETYIKKGNHDEHLERWLREGNFKTDFVNAPFYLEAMAAKLRAIRENDEEFDLLKWAMSRIGELSAVFIPRNTTMIVAGIDMGQHGDAGPNGSRGTVRNLAKTGRKVNIEHSHSAHIFDGAYQAGTSTRLDMSYLNGPSSWSHVHILTHENGKRQMIELKNGKWRA